MTRQLTQCRSGLYTGKQGNAPLPEQVMFSGDGGDLRTAELHALRSNRSKALFYSAVHSLPCQTAVLPLYLSLLNVTAPV